MFYSPSKNTWFPVELKDRYVATGTWPADATEYADSVYQAVVVNRPDGKVMQPDANGAPVLVDAPALTTAQVAAQVTAQRDRLLADSDWTQLRDVPDATATAWQPYRQALRDLTSQAGFPSSVTWPTPPAS